MHLPLFIYSFEGVEADADAEWELPDFEPVQPVAEKVVSFRWLLASARTLLCFRVGFFFELSFCSEVRTRHDEHRLTTYCLYDLFLFTRKVDQQQLQLVHHT